MENLTVSGVGGVGPAFGVGGVGGVGVGGWSRASYMDSSAYSAEAAALKPDVDDESSSRSTIWRCGT